ncbi:hypothetical protein ASPWEDRAFT_168570 [Aspergillus wentii DTO 134E9]|uniref:N-acetyltransferase domain-containing protein n=1 Tax=Aspergillus wentii DTO 134E9 TaxID=1073089 RepID=A0A1L9RUR9_ASPWE|nr:uncharacterized protein ASPWEDRAFT_168570 [Aspergillus wentii DTO 134E9]KAI9928596.1 hypothetical protein MW887_001811 [Aspergillus wentii]OJJ38670.1 hypothetical protein ASPWEDRAFT_168570 [Aspergillus wentii DTO 134E9]
MSYQYLFLPTDLPSVKTWFRKYVNLHLSSLKTNPKSFCASYETESQITDHEWVEMLSQPRYRVAICTVISHHVHPLDAEWVGMIRVYGPRLNSHGDAYYYLGGAFVSPLHRGLHITFRLGVFAVEQLFLSHMRSASYERLSRKKRRKVHFQALTSSSAACLCNYYRAMGLSGTRTMRNRDYYSQWQKVNCRKELLNQEVLCLELVVRVGGSLLDWMVDHRWLLFAQFLWLMSVLRGYMKVLSR